MPSTLPSTGYRILIVDDDDDYRALSRIRLARDTDNDYETDEARTGSQALEMLEHADYDCLLVDYRLPDTFGTDVVNEARALLGERMPPAIILTADGGEEAATLSVRVDAADFLSKRRTYGNALVRSVRNAVEKGRLRASMRVQRDQLVLANITLERRAQEIERFYHTVSHEMKTPLTGAREFVSIVRDGLLGKISDEQRDLLDDALGCCDQLTRQFHDLLDMTRLETGKLTLSIKPASLERVVQRCLAIAKTDAAARGITVERRGEQDLPEVYMDEDRIAQVVSNLLGNAIKFNDRGGRVRLVVRTSAEGDRLNIRVVDNGQGISREDCQRIFDRLYQVSEHGGPEANGGMGLGLSIAREIVSEHGDALRVMSREGRGSSFSLGLTIVDEKDTKLAA